MKISWHFVNVALRVHNYGFTTSSLYFSEQTSSQFILKLLCEWKKCGQRKSPSDSNCEMFICLPRNWKNRRCHFYGMLFILYHFLKSILIFKYMFPRWREVKLIACKVAPPFSAEKGKKPLKWQNLSIHRNLYSLFGQIIFWIWKTFHSANSVSCPGYRTGIMSEIKAGEFRDGILVLQTSSKECGPGPGYECRIVQWKLFLCISLENNTLQWRIQDFPQGGAPTPKSAIIFQFFAENCMKMKEFGPPRGRVPGSPLGSASALVF